MERENNAYTHMVEINRQKNAEKKEYAVTTIRKMVSENREVTIAALIKITGLSRSFFYKNEEVRSEVARAKASQKSKDFNSEKRKVLNKAMLGKVRVIEAELEKKKIECEKLLEENEKLKKTIRENNLARFQQL